MCLVRHSTIIFYNLPFVKHQLKYLAILPRFASRSAAFLYILIPAHLFSGCRTEISGRKSAAPHSYLLTISNLSAERTLQLLTSHSNINPSAERTPHLLTPISYLLTIFQICPRSGHRNFSFLISHFSFRIKV